MNCKQVSFWTGVFLFAVYLLVFPADLISAGALSLVNVGRGIIPPMLNAIHLALLLGVIVVSAAMAILALALCHWRKSAELAMGIALAAGLALLAFRPGDGLIWLTLASDNLPVQLHLLLPPLTILLMAVLNLFSLLRGEKSLMKPLAGLALTVFLTILFTFSAA